MPHWKQPPESPPRPLPGSGVDLWRIDLDRDDAVAATARGLLSPEELERFERFKPVEVKRRFALARGGMRSILGRYLECAPDGLEFRYGEQGKPDLVHCQNPGGLRFNLSHSHELAVLAVSVRREVGVDVERLRDNVEFSRLAARHFSPEEAGTLESLQGEDLMRRFFQIWTAKEAYIKAIGKGLRIPLDQFAVAVDDESGREPSLLHTRHAPEEKDRWSFQKLDCGDDYMGTLATEGPSGDLRFLQA